MSLEPTLEGVFTSEQVLRIAGITRRRLDYWIEKGIITADIDRAKGRGRVRLFSFSNLLEVRVAAWLRDKVSLQLIGKIVRRLRAEDSARPLAEMTFGVVEGWSGGRESHSVVVKRPDGTWEEWESGQKIMEIVLPLGTFADELRHSAAAERRRTRRVGEVEHRRGTLGSSSVVAGTRIPTASIRRLHEAGQSVDEIVASYPGLDPDDVVAALAEEAAIRGRKASAG